jgi:hypothetical protein
MRSVVIGLAAAVAAASCSRPPTVENGQATDHGVARIALPEEQLRFMLGQNVLGTMTAPMSLARLGLDRGCDIFEEATERAVASNLPQWRANLIQAYRQNVPPPELAEAVGKSPRAAHEQLGSYLPDIGLDMKQASAPILKKASSEVLSALFDEAYKADRANIDENARMRDLQRMKSEGKICGVDRQAAAS